MVTAMIVSVIVVCAAVLVLAPRPLFAEVGSSPPRRRLELGLSLGLAGIGVVVLAFGPGEAIWPRAGLALALMTLAAIVYADLRFLIIPDSYSATLAVLGLIGSHAIWPTLAGALLCGGLLAGVAWAFKRSTQVEGMGFGDVKLAAAVGALLGPEMGLWAIAASAIVAALIGLAWRRLRKGEGPLMIPYGAALALACAALLVGSRL
ncbi:MAG: peptidase [Caulobacteraceae bacterium]|nr:peptidase [Caulobacteraceae bacterium]